MTGGEAVCERCGEKTSRINNLKKIILSVCMNISSKLEVKIRSVLRKLFLYVQIMVT
jgi:hypothetical protein